MPYTDYEIAEMLLNAFVQGNAFGQEIEEILEFLQNIERDYHLQFPEEDVKKLFDDYHKDDWYYDTEDKQIKECYEE